MKEISIIIVTYNSTKDIRDCILSIYQNNDIGDALEIIVVDNKSEDVDNLKQILTEFPSVILYENKINGGYGQGNNEGIRRSSAPIIMIMNPDVRLFKPIFRKVLVDFENIGCAMLGMHQYESKQQKGHSILPIGTSIIDLLRLKLYNYFDLYNPKYFVISGACFFIRKDAFEDVGLFDENIFMYGEETDINIRLRRKGYSINIDKTLGYIHPMHSRTLSYDVLILGYNSFYYNEKKHNLDLKKDLINYIIYIKLLRFRARRIKAYEDVKIYSAFIDFLKVQNKNILNSANF